MDSPHRRGLGRSGPLDFSGEHHLEASWNSDGQGGVRELEEPADLLVHFSLGFHGRQLVDGDLPKGGKRDTPLRIDHDLMADDFEATDQLDVDLIPGTDAVVRG